MPVSWIPGGDLGTWATLRAMRALVRAGIADRLTVETAQRIVSSCPPRDVVCEALTIRAFLTSNFRFVRDPAQQETLHPARILLEQLARDGVASGDCDDAAILGATLAAAIGFTPYAVVTGYRVPGASFRHVIATVPLDASGSRWVDFDVTRPVGAPPRSPSRWMSWKLT